MTKSMKIYAVSAFAMISALGFAALPVTAGDDQGTIVSPLKAVNLDMGGKKALGYFLTNNGACELTVVVAGQTDGAYDHDSATTRVRVSVQPGSAAFIDTATGKSGEFFCGPGGSQMNARVVSRAAVKGS